MHEKRPGEVADLAVGAMPMSFRQFDDPFSDGKRAPDQLRSIEVTPAKFVPESKEPGLLGQGVATELLHCATLGELHDPQQITFQVRSAELGRALVILQISAEPVAAQNAPEHGPQ